MKAEVLERVDFEWWKADIYDFDSPSKKKGLPPAVDRGFIAPGEKVTSPSKFSKLSLQELYDPDQGDPVHIDLMRMNPFDMQECRNFTNRWGLLGTALRWQRIREPEPEERTTRDLIENPLMLSEVEVLPTIWEPQKAPSRFLKGAEYFSYFLTQDPSEVPYPEGWTRGWPPRQTYRDLWDFSGWSFYGEWVYTNRDAASDPYSLLDWIPNDVSDPYRLMLSFTRAVWSLQLPSTWEKVEGLMEHGHQVPMLHVIPYKMTSPEGKTVLQFRPKTLLDFCQLAVAIDGLRRCLNCEAIGSTKFCDSNEQSCKSSFMNRKSDQAKQFLAWLEEKDPALAKDWETNENDNPYHPAQLLEDKPLGYPQPRSLSEEERSIAIEWAQHYRENKQRKSPIRGHYDALLEVLLKDSQQTD